MANVTLDRAAVLARVNALKAKMEAFKVNRVAIKALGLPSTAAARAATPLRAQLLLTGLGLVDSNPFEVLMDQALGKEVEIPKGHASLRRVAFQFGLVPKASKETAVAEAFEGWAYPARTPSLNDTATLLRLAGAEELVSGEFDYFGVAINLNARTVAGHPMKGILLVAPDGKTQWTYSPAEAMGWVVLGALQGITEGGNAKKQFLGFIRVMYAKAAEDGGYGYKDPATESFLSSKLPVFQLGFGITGFTVRDITANAADVFAQVATQRGMTGAHAQGKFLVNLEAEVLGISIKLDATNGAPMVFTASTATAKWFKRLTLGLPLQVRLMEFDTGYFQVGTGGEHHGRLAQVLLIRDGLNFPYLGNAVSMLTRKGMATLFGAVSDVAHEVEWTGTHEPVLPVVGSKVKRGDALVVGPTTLEATVSGTVVAASTNVVAGTTHISVVVANYDRTGQLKLRSQVLKAGVAYPAWTNIDWDAFAAAHGMPPTQQYSGDVAIFAGLEPGDRPVIAGSADCNKAKGTGNAAGVVSLGANTLKTPVVYSPIAHAEGQYDGLTAAFEHRTFRPDLVVGYAVLPEIAEKMVLSKRDDCEFFPWGELVVVLQKTSGWIATDLLKVESLSVRDSFTTGYAPLEVAMAGNAMGLKHLASEIEAGGLHLLYELVAVYEAATATYDASIEVEALEAGIDEFAARIAGFTLNGVSLAVAGIPVVDITDLTDAQVVSLAARAAKPLQLPKKVAFVNGEDGDIVVVDPVVLKAFGSGDQESSLKSLFSQLCFNASLGNIKEAKRLVKQLAGCIQAIKKSPKTNQRVFRGGRVLQAKTSAGNVPQGWVAISFYGNVAKELCRQFKCTIDELWGRLVYVYRSPQCAPLPLRLYTPDAPQADLVCNHQYQPEGELYLRPVRTLEPDRFFMSPADTAFDNGDHDGDGRSMGAINTPEAILEACAFIQNAEAYRQDVLAAYQAVPSDPVVDAYKQENPAKLGWAKVGVVKYDEFVSLSKDSIVNQTKDIGNAYNFAHMALSVFGDFKVNRNNALRTHAFFVGHYEEQLAGLDKTYRKLYDLLTNDGGAVDADSNLDVTEWHAQVDELNAELGHNAADTTALKKLTEMMKAVKAVERDKTPTLTGNAFILAVAGRIIRAVSQGTYDSTGKLKPILGKADSLLAMVLPGDSTLRDLVKTKSSESVGFAALDRYLERIWPFITSEEAGEDEG